MSKRFCTILFFLLLFINSNAQLCQGSLGDPIINITFGSGGNPGSPLSAATTTYQYVTTDCPQDGFYSVRNNSVGCYSSTWHTLNADHTGNSNGYFMLVNASFQPSAFYLDTVRGLCGNTTYEFASWIMNMLVPSSCGGNTIQPNITFSIERTDGTLLQSYNTGNIAPSNAPSWKQYGFYFTTPPAGSDIVLRIVNNAPGGCGNDLSLDDITFRPCGPQITGNIDGIPAAAQSFCVGQQRNYVLTCTVSGGFAVPSFQWQRRDPANSNWIDITLANTNTLPISFSPTTPAGMYEYRLAVAEAGNMGSSQCRIYSRPFSFTVNANPVTTTSNDGPGCEGSRIIFSAGGGSQYAWSGPNGFTGSGSPLPLENVQAGAAGKYYVIVTNVSGCVAKDSSTLVVNPTPVAAIPFATTSVCEEDSVQLSVSTAAAYEWIPSTGLSNATVRDPKASPAGTTEYIAIVSNQFSCKDTAKVTVNVVQRPVANAGPDKVILTGQSVQLFASISQGNNFTWSPSPFINDLHSLQPIVDPPADTKFILNIFSGCGAAADTMFVKVYDDIFIPNAFTPNGDGKNDTWRIDALAAYTRFEVFVYGRWGQLVFHAKNELKQWEGTLKGNPLPMGAYQYYIVTGDGITFKGSLLIIR